MGRNFTIIISKNKSSFTRLNIFCIIYENKNENQNSITFPFQYLTTHDKNWFKIIAEDNRKKYFVYLLLSSPHARSCFYPHFTNKKAFKLLTD